MPQPRTSALNVSNTSSAQTTLNGSAVAGKALQVTNTNAASGATALGLSVAPGHAPFTVDSPAKVTDLNADLLDGLDSAQLQQRVTGTCAADSAVKGVAADGSVSCAAFPHAGITTIGNAIGPFPASDDIGHSHDDWGTLLFSFSAFSVPKRDGTKRDRRPFSLSAARRHATLVTAVLVGRPALVLHELKRTSQRNAGISVQLRRTAGRNLLRKCQPRWPEPRCGLRLRSGLARPSTLPRAGRPQPVRRGWAPGAWRERRRRPRCRLRLGNEERAREAVPSGTSSRGGASSPR